MKRFYILIIWSFIVGCIATFAQYQVNCIDTDGETMTFRVVGYGNNAKVASRNAELKVIKALMFEGVPNSQQRVAMVSETESVVMEKYVDELKNFFANEYQKEITRSVVVGKFGKNINNQKSITLDVTINVRALRNKLEMIGIIRKFGL